MNPTELAGKNLGHQSALRAVGKAVVQRTWVDKWTSAPTGAALRQIDHTPPSP